MNLKYLPHKASYDVLFTAECPFYDDQVSTLTYTAEVLHLKTEGPTHFIEVLKKDVTLNKEEVHDAFNDILLLTATAIEKLVLKIDAEGTILGLANHEEIKKKWFEVKQMVLDTYQGEVVAEYLSQMEAKLATTDTLWKALSRDFFYTAFFYGFYKNYGFSNAISADMLIKDMLPSQAVGATVTQSLLVTDDLYLINVSGNEKFGEFIPATAAFFKQEADIDTLPDHCSVRVDTKCQIDINTTAINTLNTEVELIFDTIYQKKMSIKIMKMQ